MLFERIVSLIKQEWNLFHQIARKDDERRLSEDDLSNKSFKEVLDRNFFILLSLATAITTFGLLSNSAATIIGAMIISPLMIPIVSLAYSLVVLNFRLVSYSLVRLFFGTALTILIAYLSTNIIGFKIPGSEILARSEPTLLDLGVAISAGLAGAFAKIRPSISDAIPGVAISVALVPPLCVVGISLATYDYALLTGGFLFFLTNLVSIIVSADLIFLWQSYGNWKKAIGTLLLLVTSMVFISFPLNSSFKKMIMDNRIRHALSEYSRIYSVKNKGFINSIKVDLLDDELLVEISVVQEPERFSEINPQKKLKFIQAFLSEKMRKPVHLKVRVLPIDIIDYEVAPISTEAN